MKSTDRSLRPYLTFSGNEPVADHVFIYPLVAEKEKIPFRSCTSSFSSGNCCNMDLLSCNTTANCAAAAISQLAQLAVLLNWDTASEVIYACVLSKKT